MVSTHIPSGKEKKGERKKKKEKKRKGLRDRVGEDRKTQVLKK